VFAVDLSPDAGAAFDPTPMLRDFGAANLVDRGVMETSTN
jgi:hypothetical protein